MTRVLTIGGARFMGRYTVRGYLEDGHDVTLFTRGETPIPFGDDAVDHVAGDRKNRSDLERAAEDVDPDVVIDFAAYHPEDVRTATDVFADVDAYVYVSSTSAYEQTATVPLREDGTPLRKCSPDQATDDTFETYGARKAEGDRIVFDAAERGINALSVRPTAIYGPHDITERQDYWIDRVNRFDRIVVPGDAYWMPIHLGYVEDAARAIRLVAERGEPGEAYNVADRFQRTVDDLLEGIANALETSVTIVHATRSELAAVDCTPADFSLCRDYPIVVSTEKIAGLGWDSTPFDEAIADTVAYHLEHDRDGTQHGPDRETEERLLATLGSHVTSLGGR